MLAQPDLNAATGSAPFRLNPRLDTALIARVYRSAGRVHIPDFFDAPTAERIHRALVEETRWRFVLHDESGDHELDVASLSELPEAERADWQSRIDRAAQRGFSYRYATFRLFEHYLQNRHRESFLMRVLEFLNLPQIRDLVRTMTGDPHVDFADGQATRYGAGDFLTVHTDEADGKNRRAAYVLNFTPEWHTDWGGMLAFLDRQGHVEEAYRPAFNALNLFRVPALHAVTQVASYATAARYSITGWFRQTPPAG